MREELKNCSPIKLSNIRLLLLVLPPYSTYMVQEYEAVYAHTPSYARIHVGKSIKRWLGGTNTVYDRIVTALSLLCYT